MNKLQPNWFLVITEPQKEFQTAKRIRRLGGGAYVPGFKKYHHVNGIERSRGADKKPVAKPVMNGYLFLSDPEISVSYGKKPLRWKRALQDYGLIRSPNLYSDRCVILSHSMMRTIKDNFRGQEMGAKEAHKWMQTNLEYEVGDRVRFNEDGSFGGYEAVVKEIKDGRALVDMLFAKETHAIDVPLEQLERAG